MFNFFFLFKGHRPTIISILEVLKMISQLSESNHLCVLLCIFLSRAQVDLCVDRKFIHDYNKILYLFDIGEKS